MTLLKHFFGNNYKFYRFEHFLVNIADFAFEEVGNPQGASLGDLKNHQNHSKKVFRIPWRRHFFDFIDVFDFLTFLTLLEFSKKMTALVDVLGG